ncbi:MAG: uroporphyrinogen-III synthase [Pseudomonadota bacterium]
MAELAGRGVLVTRPVAQSEELVDAIEAAGGDAVCLPALEIAGLDETSIDTQLASLPDPDITLFVSPNAVRFGLPYAKGLVGSIGPGTAGAIRALDRAVDIVPEGGYNSEHLLMTPALSDITGKTIRIVRGQSGRELLGQTLAHRGARVDYLSVYTRRRPEHPQARLDEVLSRWSSGGIDAWIIMSVETLDNFLALTGEEGAALAARTPLVTPAERVLKEAEERLPGVFVALSQGTAATDLVDAVDGVIVPQS